MEQIRTYPCLYDKSKISYNERDINRNTRSKVAEKLDFICKCRYQMFICKCRYQKDFHAFPVVKNRRVRANLSSTEIHFLRRVSIFEMKWAIIARRCSNLSGDI